MAKNWIKQFGPGEQFQRCRPEYNPEVLNNPHKGTATFRCVNGEPLRQYRTGMYGKALDPVPTGKKWRTDLYPHCRIAYYRWWWRELEPARGKFNFDPIDKALAKAARAGMTLEFRSMPFVADDAPEWYWAAGASPDEAELRSSGQRVIDHNDPLYLKYWGDHIAALGERYDGHPNIEHVDIGYGGSCGEVGGNTSCLNSRKLVDMYLDAFQVTPLLSMLGTEGCRYAGKMKSRQIGWRCDCFGDLRNDGHGVVPDHLAWDHTHDLYPYEIQHEVADSWKLAPVVLETCWNVPWWWERKWDVEAIIEMGYKYHASVFMPKSFYIPEPWYDKLVDFSERLGYRFHILQITLPLARKAGEKFTTVITIDNKGVAPIYKPYKMALRFTQGKKHHVVTLREDIRNWMPDLHWFTEEFALPPGLKPGKARVSTAIVNDKNEPVVKFAVKPLGKSGWADLTEMEVL